jgi:hypothetical protein
MPQDPHSKPSFSPLRRWGIGLNVCLVILLVFSIVVMVNYLSRDYHRRFYWSTRNHTVLSPLTLQFVKSLTNEIKVILYYDKNERLYSTVADLINEYKLANSKIFVETVDYLRDVAKAQKVKEDYKLAAATDKNLIIFDCNGKLQFVPGDALAQYIVQQVPDAKEREFIRKPTAFEGEKAFTAALIAVTNPKPLLAYVLQDHGEHSFDSGDPNYGYLKFHLLLGQNYIQVFPLSLRETNCVPADCHLLILAGPQVPIPDEELEKIDQYLSQGGRLLVLLHARSPIAGLARILAKWGVQLGIDTIKDPEHTVLGTDMIVRNFNRQHPVVDKLVGSEIYLIRPRSVGKLKLLSPTADAPTVEELAFTGPSAFTGDHPQSQQQFPLMVAVEKGAIKGAVTERGSTRIVVVGESIFLANTPIESADNRWFGWHAVNWLLARTQLLRGIGPKSVLEYKLTMGRNQLQTAQWILLAGMPGAVLMLGGLVWLRRRH